MSITIKFHPGAPKAPGWKHGVGSTLDNEAGFAENYGYDVSSGRVRDCFGENGIGGSEWYINYLGSCATGISPADEFFAQPDNFILYQNYPNPFNPTTTIDFALSTGAEVSVKIFNLLGQEVRTLVNAAYSPGSYSVEWDGVNNSGQAVSSGVYMYKLSVDNFSQTRKMMLMR